MKQFVVFLLPSLWFAAGCGQTKTSEDKKLTTLRDIVRDPAKTSYERGKALLQIFHDYIPPHCDSDKVRDVFRDVDWLREGTSHLFLFQTGLHPLTIQGGSTLFSVALFVKDPKDTHFYVYLRLSGRCSEDDLPHFFGPEGNGGDTRLIEFALCESGGGTIIVDSSGTHQWP